MEEPAGDKPYEATPRKLEQARKRGELPRSTDLFAAAAYLGLLLFAFAAAPRAIPEAAGAMAAILARAGEITERGASSAAVAAMMAEILLPLGLLLGIPFVAVATMVALQQAWVVAPEKLEPKLSRISPISNAQQKFGRNGLFEFAKSVVKLVIVSVFLGIFFAARLPEMITAIRTGMANVVSLALRDTVDFLVVVSIAAFAIGGIDYLWQRAEHLRSQRMTRKELEDEQKESEGDPWVKQQRRQRGFDIATNRMIQDVPKADVVIVNPQHYAVALRWDRARRGAAPICVAKGVDEVAARIREVAAEAGVPVHRDPPTARALHATVAVGQEILAEHYRPVAAAIRFAEAMRQRARSRG